MHRQQVGTVTHPAHFATVVKDLETVTDKTKLLAKPANAKTLRDFLVNELISGNGLRRTPPTPSTPAPTAAVADLNFELSDEECCAHVYCSKQFSCR